MLIRVPCEVMPGLRDKEATVKITDFNGRPQFFPLDRGMIVTEGNKTYLPLPLVATDPKSQAVLVSLPIEADSGAHRIWVKMNQINNLPEGLAS